MRKFKNKINLFYFYFEITKNIHSFAYAFVTDKSRLLHLYLFINESNTL